MQITQEIRNLFHMHYTGDPQSLEVALQQLKDADCSQMMCVKLVKEELSLSLWDADDIVLNSRAWRAQRDANLAFRKGVFTALKAMNDAED